MNCVTSVIFSPRGIQRNNIEQVSIKTAFLMSFTTTLGVFPRISDSAVQMLTLKMEFLNIFILSFSRKPLFSYLKYDKSKPIEKRVLRNTCVHGYRALVTSSGELTICTSLDPPSSTVCSKNCEKKGVPIQSKCLVCLFWTTVGTWRTQWKRTSSFYGYNTPQKHNSV